MEFVINFIIPIAVFFSIYFLFFYENSEKRLANLEIKRKNKEEFNKLIEGVKVKFISGDFSKDSSFHGVIKEKRVMNSWECDNQLIYWIVDIYKDKVLAANKTMTFD